MRIARVLTTVAACLVAALASAQPTAGNSPAVPAPATANRGLAIANKPWTGDFDRMLERRMIRVDAPYSRSLYFNDTGRERGLAAELVRDFDRWLRALASYSHERGNDALAQHYAERLRSVAAER